MLVELLSGQAVVEAKDYAIMDWDEMQEVKKEHALLATRIATITRSLALETRLRDSAAKLARLSAPSASTLPPLPSASSKPRVTREQAEAQLAAANAKMDSIAAEMYKLGWKEAELRTKLLRHTAGVLGLSLRRKEEEDARVAQTPLQSNTAAFGSSSPHSDQPLSPASRFEGRHFFAGNKEAVMPTARGGATSPIASPPLGSSMNGSFGAANFDDGSGAKVRDLEAKVQELQAALSSARAEHEEQERTRSADAARSNEVELDQLRDELSESRRRESGSREEATTSRREAFDTKRELSELRREAEVLRDDLRYAKDASEKAKREAEDARREMDSVKNYGGEAKRDIEDAKSREEEARQELEKATADLREAEQRATEAEARIAEVEQEVDRVRDEGDDEIRRLQDELEAAVLSHGSVDQETEGEKQARAELASALKERTSITQAVGDVLRRHRTRQPVLRDLPSFDDTNDHADLPSYLSSSLDSHFDRLTNHVTSLSTDLDSARAEHEERRSGLESSLREATEHRDRFRSEADSHRSAKEDLDRTHEELQARVREQEEQLAALASLQTDLATASADEGKLRQEISSLKMTLADVEKQLADVSAQQDDHKSRAAAAEQEVAETREKGAKLDQQMKELEERMTVSANQEVTMLERLNDLTESLEQTRGEKRKLDALVPSLQTQVRTLEAEKASLSQNLVAAQLETSRLAARPDESAKLAEVENELQDLKDQLQDAMDELDDAKAREAKTRGQLLDELSSVQSELSSTRTKLRQAERRNGAAK
uniref:Up-regulated during septation protein 1 domain-containing protein n=1 Tax=Leucosporidium scottii TaxID=5278 RepID=A0A0H5FTR7_9BASI|nr:hypothetical protein ls5930a1_00140 [Leucosporidium scottii]